MKCVILCELSKHLLSSSTVQKLLIQPRHSISKSTGYFFIVNDDDVLEYRDNYPRNANVSVSQQDGKDADPKP